MTFELTEIHIDESDRFRVHVFPGRMDDNEVLCVLGERPVQDGFSANGSPQQEFESQGIVNALDEIPFLVRVHTSAAADRTYLDVRMQGIGMLYFIVDTRGDSPMIGG